MRYMYQYTDRIVKCRLCICSRLVFDQSTVSRFEILQLSSRVSLDLRWTTTDLVERCHQRPNDGWAFAVYGDSRLKRQPIPRALLQVLVSYWRAEQRAVRRRTFIPSLQTSRTWDPPQSSSFNPFPLLSPYIIPTSTKIFS